MDRVFESGASATPPTPPASPSSGYPTKGSPAGAVPPTKPGPWWYYMITEELRAVLAAASITPDYANVGQLAQAIQALISASGFKQLRTISASVSANALTLGVAAGSLEFRSSTLTNGAPNTRGFSALSLVVPSGATLGTVSGQSARLALIAVDNAGTVELAVANLAGGVNLDETTLISTTSISGTSNSAGVIYSTTARSNVPFRVVGFIDITEATAGTWASAPTLVQGIGGQALAAMASIGYGQSWQSVTRSPGTTYYNTTGRPILVSWQGTYSAGAATSWTVNGVSGLWYLSNAFSSPQANSAVILVPPGASYSLVVNAGTFTAITANELR